MTKPTFEAETVTVAIDAPAADVYAFISDPRNLTRWAPNFALSVEEEGDHWRVQMEEGSVTARFTPKNEFGICDHWVEMPGHPTFYNPMRVIGNGAGSALLFTVFRQPDWTKQRFRDDIARVESDMQLLKRIVEA